MKSRLAAILFSLCLAAGPAWSLTWQGVRDDFLGPGRADLLLSCAQGREMNSLGKSFWDYEQMQRHKKYFRSVGRSNEYIQAFLGGEAAAMAKVCPDVK